MLPERSAGRLRGEAFARKFRRKMPQEDVAGWVFEEEVPEKFL
jgi:hypothetical protein